MLGRGSAGQVPQTMLVPILVCPFGLDPEQEQLTQCLTRLFVSLSLFNHY
jgi:hypothetical protein